MSSSWRLIVTNDSHLRHDRALKGVHEPSRAMACGAGSSNPPPRPLKTARGG